MAKDKPSSVPDLFLTIWIIVRVGLILVIWLGIFLALFLGYFTVPIAVVAGFSVIYALTDATFLIRHQIRARSRLGREEMLRTRSKADEEDPSA